MRLYDGKSAITWQDGGRLSAAKMRKEPRFSQLFQTQCVLFDNGEGVTYSFKPLDAMLARYGAESFEGLEQAIEASWAAPSTEDRVAQLEADSLDKDEAITELYEMLLGGE